uniref:Uncharacterized protein n=1 Tax=Ascaris lumbricoides TaxID=6252 RepID=A0A9J2P8H6_ASCLU
MKDFNIEFSEFCCHFGLNFGTVMAHTRFDETIETLCGCHLPHYDCTLNPLPALQKLLAPRRVKHQARSTRIKEQ